MGVYSQPLISVMETCLLMARHPVLRRRELKSGHSRERENLHLARIEGAGADMLVVVMKEL